MGILHKDLECFVEDDHHHIHLSLPAPIAKDEGVVIEKSNIIRCSCCGEFLKTKTKTSSYTKGKHASAFSQAPAPSPRAPLSLLHRSNEQRGLELPHGRSTDLKLLSENESELPEDENGSQAITSDSQCEYNMIYFAFSFL